MLLSLQFICLRSHHMHFYMLSRRWWAIDALRRKVTAKINMAAGYVHFIIGDPVCLQIITSPNRGCLILAGLQFIRERRSYRGMLQLPHTNPRLSDYLHHCYILVLSLLKPRNMWDPQPELRYNTRTVNKKPVTVSPFCHLYNIQQMKLHRFGYYDNAIITVI